MRSILARNFCPPSLKSGERHAILILAIYLQEKAARISSVDVTIEDVTAFANEFIADVEAGVHVEKGWPNVNLGTTSLIYTSLYLYPYHQS